MSPYQHGEVFVTDDGAETDLDLGHYERFVDEALNEKSSVSSGKVYWSVLNRERQGGYLGGTVQIIPHVTDEIKRRIYDHGRRPDRRCHHRDRRHGGRYREPAVSGGHPSGRSRARDAKTCSSSMCRSSCPSPAAASSRASPRSTRSKSSLSEGIQPDVLVVPHGRAACTDDIRHKIALFCNVEPDCVIQNVNGVHALRGAVAA